MNVLLDTHALIWYFESSKKLPSRIINVIEDVSNDIYLSDASIWEIAIKISIGKLHIPIPFSNLPAELASKQIQQLAIQHTHYTEFIALPFHHDDPFDRMIISQAIRENFTIITKDAHFKLYPVKVLWK